MSKRTRYLVAYDISDPKRLRRVARTVEGYGRRLQYSVFECSLSELMREELKAELEEIIHHDADQVLFVSLGPASGDSSLLIEAVGQPYARQTVVTII